MSFRSVRFALVVILPLFAIVLSPAARSAGLTLHLTHSQQIALQETRTIGARHQVADLLVAVVWDESSFCRDLIGDDHSSFGCGQLQLRTAAQYAGRKVTEHELIHDRAFNLELSARFLRHCVARFGIARGLYCYNHGEPAAHAAKAGVVARDRYVRRVRHLFHEVTGQ